MKNKSNQAKLHIDYFSKNNLFFSVGCSENRAPDQLQVGGRTGKQSLNFRWLFILSIWVEQWSNVKLPLWIYLDLQLYSSFSSAFSWKNWLVSNSYLIFLDFSGPRILPSRTWWSLASTSTTTSPRSPPENRRSPDSSAASTTVSEKCENLSF